MLESMANMQRPTSWALFWTSTEMIWLVAVVMPNPKLRWQTSLWIILMIKSNFFYFLVDSGRIFWVIHIVFVLKGWRDSTVKRESFALRQDMEVRTQWQRFLQKSRWKVARTARNSLRTISSACIQLLPKVIKPVRYILIDNATWLDDFHSFSASIAQTQSRWRAFISCKVH